jgi:hypothetical protein
MAFKIQRQAKPSVVKLQEGLLRVSKNENPINKMGISLKLNTQDGSLDGSIRFFAAKTGLSSEQELIEAIERFINEDLKATDVSLER